MSDAREIASKNSILRRLLLSEDEENQAETESFFPLRAKNIIKQRLSNLWFSGRSSEKGSSNPKEIVHHVSDSPSESCIACEINQCCQKDINFGDEFGDDTLQSSDSIVKNDNFLQTFYGVSLLPGNSPCEEGDIPLVFSDKKDALRAVKKYKGARFKPFSKKADALAFASQSVDEICPSPKPKSPLYQVPETNNALEKTLFKGPKSQEMVKLRKAIESGDEEYFKETVWSNPRYLISSGDTPAIMQEGFRYNGLHVAAKYKQPHLCQLIIDTIEDPKFMELLYYDDSNEVRLQRIQFITDLYLNTPDKGLCEIPLHFAAKFGCLEAVEILASHPACDKTRQNKYGLTPKDIICERCPATSEELKKQIEEAFDDQFFVPVLRSDDNSTQPVIGEPYSPRNRRKPYTCSSLKSPGSPRDPFQCIKAVAGPMSPKQATKFYQMWKTPPSSMFKAPKTQQLNWLRLADTEKGLECVGRYIAHSVNTHWIEYWPSLKAWCNLSSEEGLQMLENHLKEVCQEARAEIHDTDQILKVKGQGTFSVQQSQSNGMSDENLEQEQTTQLQNASTSSTNSSGISQLCCKLQKFHFDDTGDNLLTSPDMPNVLRSCNAAVVADSRSSVFTNNWDAEKKEELLSSTTDVNEFLLDNVKQEVDFPSFDHFNDSNYVNGHAGHLYFEKDEKSSTPKSKREGNRDISLSQSKISSFTALKGVVCSLMEVLLELSMNAESVILQIDTLQTYLWDNVYSHVEYMLTSDVYDSDERGTVHSEIALSVCKEAQESFVKHEINLLKRCLASYLESKFSAISSDDENSTNRERSELKQKLSSFRRKTTWKHLTCILTFLCEYLSYGNSVDKLIFTSCHCEWLDPFMFSNCHRKNPVPKCGASCSCINTISQFCSANIRDQAHLKGNHLIGLDDEKCVLETISSEEDEGSDPYVTPPSSPVATSCDTVNKYAGPDEDLEVYVHGPLPSKADVDMIRVIEHINVNPVLFPYVSRWKYLVMSFDKQTIDCWPSPAGRSFHLRNSYFKSKTPYSLSQLRKFEKTGSPLKISTPLQGSPSNKCLFQISPINSRNLLKEFSDIEECAL